MIKSLGITKGVIIILISLFYSIHSEDIKQTREGEFVAETKDPSGNGLPEAELILSPDEKPFAKKVFKSDKDGKVKIDKETYKDKSIWLAKHP